MNAIALKRAFDAADSIDINTVLNSSSDCLLFLSHDWRILLVNDLALQEISGGRDLVGLDFWQAFPDAIGSDLERNYRAAMHERAPRYFEAHLARPDAWYEIHANPIAAGLSIGFRKSSERKATQARIETGDDRMIGAACNPMGLQDVRQALADRERQLETVFSQALVGIMHCEPGGRVVMVNDAFCEILGRTKTQLEGLTFADYTHPDDLAGNLELYAQKLCNGESFQVEKRYVRPDGATVWCAVGVSFVVGSGGEVQSCIVVAEDITPRRQVAEELRASRELLQTVIDGADDLIFAKDLSGRFVLTNRALDEACGNLVANRASDVFSEELAASFEAVSAEVIATGERRIVDEVIPVRGASRLFQTIRVPWRSGDDVAGVIGISRDITDRSKAEAALKESEALNRSIVEASTDGIKLIDLNGKIAFINKAGCRALGISAAYEVVGTDWVKTWPAVTQGAARHALRRAQAGEVAQFTAERVALDGSAKWWDVVLSPVSGGDGLPSRLVCISRDVTQQKLTDERVRWNATHDALTGLPNRTLFNTRLSEAILAAEASGGRVGLLQLDVDHFKQVNDALGHDAGDALLSTFADRLRRFVRSGDTVARLGGDEFAVIIPGLQADQDIAGIVESILMRMKEPFVYAERILDCRASIGASIYPAHGRSPEALLKNADTALYAAKSAGRGGLMVFHPEMRAEVQKRSLMIARARDAVQDNRIVPYYQPKIDFRTGCIAGFEALLRWRDPKGRLSKPAALAAAFEDLEVACAISERMLAQSVLDAAQWLSKGVAFGHVAINAAAAEFRYDNFAERVLETLHAAGLPTRRFQVEVTETVFLGRGSEHVERALKLLSKEGVTIALDDFGTGYASLRHLKQFPVDVIKIDQSFVRDLHKGPGDAAIVDAVLNLGRNLGISTVAEGIETQAQAEYLDEAGCNYAQGFLYSRAVPAARVPGLIKRFSEVDRCVPALR